MNDTFAVRISETFRGAADDRQRLLRVDPSAARISRDGLERAPDEKLHRHIDDVAIAIEIEHGHDVRMRKRLCFARLSL